MDTKKIGRFITELRKEQQMTQSQLAEQIHVTDKAISKWERGAGLPDITMLEPLADALHVSIVELMKGERISKEQAPEEDFRVALKKLIDIVSQEKYRKRRRWMTGIAGCIVLVVSFVFCFVEKGYWDVLNMGIHGMDHNTDNFATIRGFRPGKWSLDIDLGEPESNVGKVLFEEDGYSIVVDEVYHNNEYYCVGFRSYGKYNMNEGAVYSALHWNTDEEGTTSTDWISKVYIRCGEYEWEAALRGYGGDPKDGARFDIYVYPAPATAEIELQDELPQKVTVTFDELAYQEWYRMK